jgi:hypothetical protein
MADGTTSQENESNYLDTLTWMSDGDYKAQEDLANNPQSGHEAMETVSHFLGNRLTELAIANIELKRGEGDQNKVDQKKKIIENYIASQGGPEGIASQLNRANGTKYEEKALKQGISIFGGSVGNK